MSDTRRPYWDVLALAAGALPLILVILIEAFGSRGDGMMIFVGFAGSVTWLVALACVPLVGAGALMGWRTGNRILIVAGGLLLILSAAPSLLLLAACFNGNCI